MPFTVCFLSFSGAVYMCIFVMFRHIHFFFLLQVEVPPPSTSGTLVKEVMTAQFATHLGVEKEPPSGDVAKEVGQAMKDAQPTLPSAPLAVQDPEASQPLIP